MPRLTFAGCGDAFGSGGRFKTCFHVDAQEGRFLIDCGASSVIALKQAGIDRNAIGTIFVTHFHGDHFGGVPYFILGAQFFSRRTEPLTIVGPTGIGDWFERTMETAFPGSAGARRKFETRLMEVEPGEAVTANGVSAATTRAHHAPKPGPFLAYRFEVDGKIIAYTGDGEWVDGLAAIGRNADLLIAEAYFYDRPTPFHLNLATLAGHLPEMAPKRLILTHMSEDMLARADALDYEFAEDGLIVEV